jgi:hypothetical protein
MFCMVDQSNATESLLERTKRLLDERGPTPLREIAEGAQVSLDWLRSVSCGRAKNPGIQPLERLYGYLLDFHAARRFERRSEARAS